MVPVTVGFWMHRPRPSARGCRFAVGWPVSPLFCKARASASRRLGLLPSQHGSQPLEVADDHGEGDVALESADAVVGAAIQAVVPQGVDGRLDGGVLGCRNSPIIEPI